MKKELETSSKHKRSILTIVGLSLLLIIVFLGISNFIEVKKNETLLYKIQQYVTYSKKDWENYEQNQKFLDENPAIASSTDTVDVASSADFHSYDTTRMTEAVKREELKLIKSANFDQLKKADNPPTDNDAQAALIRFTQGRLTDVIINQKLDIKIGKCYENKNTEGNFRCVSCMIMLYNRDAKTWQEAPNGENFMQNAYDFYQASENDIWDAKDLSMRIPYEYEFFRKYE
jgi:hypothetical protein